MNSDIDLYSWSFVQRTEFKQLKCPKRFHQHPRRSLKKFELSFQDEPPLEAITVVSMMSLYDICKFCHSNGEAEAQYRSHQLKNMSGLVICPVLRSFTCPICKATGSLLTPRG